MKKGYQRGHSALLRGNWNNLSNASTFNWNLNNAASNVNRNIGSQLANFVLSIKNLVKPCPLAKHNNEKPCAGRISGNLERSRPIVSILVLLDESFEVVPALAVPLGD